MCKCDPCIRTPFCGVGDCQWPARSKEAQSELVLDLPMSPEEIKSLKIVNLCPEVFQVVNKLLAQKFDGYDATILAKDVVAGLIAKGIPRERVYDENMMDFEPAYERMGWHVVYDRPAYNETYDANYKFTPKK